MSDNTNLRKFDVSAFLAKIYAKAQSEVTEESAALLFGDTGTEESYERKIAKLGHYSQYGIGETINTVTVGMFTDYGLVTARINTDESHNVILSSVKLLSDRKSLVSKARKAGVNTPDIGGKAWAVTHPVKGVFVIDGTMALRYDANSGFMPHSNSQESYWINAIVDRNEKWFKISK